jgi:peptidoglycan/xylan/chitin deacetylase (PgdA/CDA1 family)
LSDVAWTRAWIDKHFLDSIGLAFVENEFYLPGTLPNFSKVKGRPVLWAQTSSHEAQCLLSMDAGRWNAVAGLEDWMARIRSCEGRQPRQPFYTRVPYFDVGMVPAWIRTLIFQRVFHNGVSREWPFELKRSSGTQRLSKALQAIGAENPFGKSGDVPVWPVGKRAALIITVDVDTDYCLRQPNNRIADVLQENGLRAAWFFVTGRYQIRSGPLESLIRRGDEIGWHGHRHDHKMAFAGSKERSRRMESAEDFLRSYEVVGMRMDNFLWSPALYADLSKYIKYDTSFLDCFPYSEEGRGCSTGLPFEMPSGIWQLPTTISCDQILPPSWDCKRRFELIRRQIHAQVALGGVIHILLHPEPSITMAAENMSLLMDILKEISLIRNDLWHVLPKELFEFCRAESLRFVS